VPAAGEGMEININVASVTYFETMRVPLVAGRVFDSRDRTDGKRVIVVNDVLADRYYRGAAVGRQAIDSRDIEFEIVGVVRTGRYRNLQEAPLPIVYYPLAQEPEARMTLVARTSSDPGRHVETITGAMRRVRSSVPVFQSMTLEKYMSEALTVERLATALVGSCGAMALLLAMVGVYGVMAFAVALRAREIGVRLALGARPLQIVRLVFAEGFRVIGIGLAIGLAAAVALPGLLGFFLHGMSGHDGLSFAAAPSLLALVAAIAAIAPVRRALGVDPMIVLRYQ
jgi:putative ABC transport system permease protein